MAENFNKEQERIERLKRGLYSRQTPDIIDPGRSEFKRQNEHSGDGRDNSSAGEWQAAGGESKFDVLVSRFAHSTANKHTFAKKLLIISAAIFVISAVIAGIAFLGGMNLISSKNVDIKVVGPISIGGGQNISFDIEVVNQNRTDLQAAKLTIEYPEGLRSTDNIEEELTSESFSLGDIESGKTARQKIDAFIFGKKEEVKEFNITVEYRVPNSNALFYKEKVHQITIDSSPVIITSTYPKEVNSNQSIEFAVEIASNSGETLGDFLLNIEYPFGFTFSTASPAPSFASNTWKMNIGSGEKRTIRVRGTIAGQDNEERVFKVNAGTASPDDERKIGVLFTSSNESIRVERPFIGVDLSLGGGASGVVGAGGVSADLTIINNLPERIYNATVEARFSGAAFSENSVNAGSGGFFRSVDDTILWDRRSIAALGELGPGEDIGMDFRFTPLSYQSIPSGASPEIKVRVRVAGERILSSGAVESIESIEEKTIKLATNLALNPRIVRGQGSIENSGPIPPKADTETTYTVIWNLSNTFNSANNIEVKAVLPQYVKWTNVKSPASEDITFNPTTNEVLWRVSQIAAGAGYKSAAKEVQFQISFLPSVSQINSTPELMGPVAIKGTDRVTNTPINSTAPALTTSFSSDSSFRSGDDKVVQ